MRKWFKTTMRTFFDRLGAGAGGRPRPEPDTAPDSGSGNGSLPTGIHCEALEPRVLLSASSDGLAAGAAVQAGPIAEHAAIEVEQVQFSQQNQALSNDLLQSNEINADARPAATSALESVDILASADSQPLDSISIRHELAVVDGGIVDYEQLVTDLLSDRDDGRQIEVVVLDPLLDGVAQISDLLAERQDIDAVHLVSHGTDRGVKLGDTWIYPENLADYTGDIATWAASLTEGADILFYGCNFAATDEGRTLLGIFGELTGVDVAASVDDTGHALLGGDWDLEYQVGDVETPVTFSADLQEGWAGLLAETVHESYETGTDSQELSSGQSWGQTFVNSGSGTYTVNRISVWMMEDNSSDKTVTVSLLDAWGGTVLGSSTINSDALSDSPTFTRQDFDFTDATLNFNTTYYIRIDYASASGKVHVQTHNTGAYAGGDLLDNGVAQTGKDMLFRVVEVTGNNAPTASGVPTDVTVTEDVASNFDLSAVTFADADGDPLIVTLAASDGTFAAVSSGGVTIGGSGTATLTLDGTAAAINTYLDTITNIEYTGANNVSGGDAATFTLNANDGMVNPEVGSGNIDITAVNDVPTLTSFAAAIDTTAEETQVEITFAELVAQGDEADVDGTVDAFVVKAVSSGTLLIGANAGAATAWVAGANDTIDGLNNAYWTPATDATGTLNAFTAVAEDNSGAESVTPVQAQVTVTAVNDAPTATIGPIGFGVDEDDGFRGLGGFSVSDSDIGGGQVEVTLSVNDGAINLVATTGLTFTGGANGTADMTFTATVTDANNALATLEYAGDPDFNGIDTITMTVDDQGNSGSGGPLNDSDTATVTVSPVNDAPVNSVPGAQTTLMNTALVFSSGNGNLISIGDVDAGTVEVELTATNGTLTLSGVGGLTFTSGGNGTGSMKFTGTITNINTALDGMSFDPTPAYSGAASLQIDTDDLGNTGVGGTLGDNDTVGITVNATNTPPIATNLDAAETYTEDIPLDLTDIVITDADSANVTATLTMSNPAAGTLSTGTSGLVTSTFAAGVWSASGAIADVNTLLAGVTFTPTANFNGGFTIATSVDDGIAPAVTGNKVVTGTPVNDPPTSTLFLGPIDATVEDTQSEITFAELAAQGDEADLEGTVDGFVVKVVNGGTLLIGADAGSATAWAAGTNDTIDGTNNAYWTPATNATGTLNAFTVVAEDNSGDESVMAVQATVTVTAVNDAPTASNLNAGETYSEGTPLNLTNIVISDVDSANVTVTLTLSDLTAGTLSTGTSGLVTSTFAAGVWTASGALGDVNTLLAETTFNPAAGYTNNFTIATSVDDGVAPAVTGTKNVTLTTPPAPEPPPPVIEEVTPDPIIPPEPEPEPPPPAEEPGPAEEEGETTPEADALGAEDEGVAATEIPPTAAGTGAGSSQQRSGTSTLRGFGQRTIGSVSLTQEAEFEQPADSATTLESQPAWSIVPPRAATTAFGSLSTQFSTLTVKAIEFLQESLDGMKKETEEQIKLNQVVASSAIAVTTGLSMGYVAWLLRSGVLLSSLLSTMPAWRILDPLPVLAGKLDFDEEEDEESLETIIEQPSQPSDDDSPEEGSDADSTDLKDT